MSKTQNSVFAVLDDLECSVNQLEKTAQEKVLAAKKLKQSALNAIERIDKLEEILKQAAK
ncbi:MAG: hypothetical protein MR368_02835 [Azospirillum sp.]|mgnify:FL=1|nr:hypothetical protein [Azospirillum sp.]